MDRPAQEAVTAARGFDLWKLLHGSLIGSLAIGLSAALEYVFFLLAGRWLTPAEFGLLSAASSILLILVAIVTSGIGTSVAKFVAELPAEKARISVSSGIALQIAVALVAAALLVGVTFLWTPPGWEDMAPMLVAISWMMPALALGAMLPLVFQGLHRITEFGAAQMANVGARILAAAVLVDLGLGAEGALLAFFPGALTACFFCFSRLRSHISPGFIDLEELRRIARFSIPVSISTVLIGLFARSDVVFLKLFLVESINDSVGQYTAPALVARSIFYLGCGLPLVLLPTVSASRDLGRIELGRILVATTAALGLATGLADRFGARALGFFFPESLTELASLLTPLMIAMSVLTLVYILATILIALGRPGPAAGSLLLGFVLFALGARVSIPGATLGPSLVVPALGPRGVVLALTVGGAVSLLLLGGLVWRESRPRPSHAMENVST